MFSEGRAIGAAAAVSASGKIPLYASNFARSSGSGAASKNWLTGLVALPAAGFSQIFYMVTVTIEYDKIPKMSTLY